MSEGDRDNARAGKQSLRGRMLAQLQNDLTPAVRAAYARDLRRQAAALLKSGERPLHIALYAPLRHEVDLTPLLAQFPRHRFYFPRCLPGRALEFRRVRRLGDDLEPGSLGIPAPRASLPRIDPERLDLAFIPGLAFTLDGHRLGYGGGYYDRFLPRCARATLVACVFPEQIVPSLPVEEHDLPVDRVLVARCDEEAK